MYLHKTPKFIQKLFPEIIWNIQTSDKKIYLSFDDGPNKAVTPWVLEVLQSFNAMATFFCTGKRVEQNRHLFDKIVESGHSIGQHGYNHLSGWVSKNQSYFSDVEKAQEIIQSKFFRPPFGQIKMSQYLMLKNKYKIVMWDVLAGDFDPKLSEESCLEKSITYSKQGTIIVFHDNIKSHDKLRYVLPRYLEHFYSLGYSAEKISLSF